MHREARVWQQRDADSRLHFGLQASEKAAPAAWGHVSGSCDSVGRDGLTNAGGAALVCCQKGDPEFGHTNLISCDQRGWKEKPGNTEAGDGKESRGFVEALRPGVPVV